MVFWLVTSKPRVEGLGELRRRLDSREISRMRPFGRSLENGLVNARLRRMGLLYGKRRTIVFHLSRWRGLLSSTITLTILLSRIWETRVEDGKNKQTYPPSGTLM